VYPEPEKYLSEMRTYYKTDITRSYEKRLESLEKLKLSIEKNEESILRALKKDLKKSKTEAYMTEIGVVIEELNYVINNLRKWMKPKKVRTPISQIGSKSTIYREPYGVVLIMAPWNYPFNLAIMPLIGAIAGGNVVLIRTSSETPSVSEVIEHMIEETFEKDYIHFIKGDHAITDKIIELGVDYIFFTGSQKVGKYIMSRASENLTPITLELGGKNPTIVHKDANIKVAAERIVWGKFLNAGQTCLAPDHVYVHSSIESDFKKELVKVINRFYGENPKKSLDYGRIVNEKQFDRLINYLNEVKVIYGGECDRDELYIEPTLMSMVSEYDDVMKEEIFGPILPVLNYENMEDLIEELRDRPKSLALYVFSENDIFVDRVIEKLHYGGGCVNDTLSHIVNNRLPFGGVGESGMGLYHGKESFDTFTHQKSVLKKSTKIRIKLPYPPYKEKEFEWIKKIMK
jgi:aldehyde dehydrogenase (NAD+)